MESARRARSACRLGRPRRSCVQRGRISGPGWPRVIGSRRASGRRLPAGAARDLRPQDARRRADPAIPLSEDATDGRPAVGQLGLTSARHRARGLQGHYSWVRFHPRRHGTNVMLFPRGPDSDGIAPAEGSGEMKRAAITEKCGGRQGYQHTPEAPTRPSAVSRASPTASRSVRRDEAASTP